MRLTIISTCCVILIGAATIPPKTLSQDTPAQDTSRWGIVDRAEATQLLRSRGVVVPRVVRDDQGHVTRLFLSGMTLSAEEVKELCELPRLRVLVLLQANIKDADVATLTKCPRLEHLNLCGTEVSDAVIDSLIQLESLKTICLGGVNVSPQAMAELRDYNETRKPKLRWGYSQRKQEPEPEQPEQEPPAPE